METVEPVWTVYALSEDWETPGRNTLMNDIFELLKLENIATHDGYQELRPEVVVALEPDIIITDSVLSVIGDPELSELHLVQDVSHIAHHIFVLSEGYSFSPDSRHFMDAVEELASFVYPEVFGEDDGHGPLALGRSPSARRRTTRRRAPPGRRPPPGRSRPRGCLRAPEALLHGERLRHVGTPWALAVMP